MLDLLALTSFGSLGPYLLFNLFLNRNVLVGAVLPQGITRKYTKFGQRVR